MMAFARENLHRQNIPEARLSRVRCISGTAATGVLLCLAALIPYDRLMREPRAASDLVLLAPGDPPVHTVADLSRIYGISPAAQANFRIDESGIHYLRKPMPEIEEHR